MPRNLVFREDGKMVNVARKQGQLFVCASGCCCGHTERDYAPVPEELYHSEWERRKLRNKVHLTVGGCLGPCPLANVVLLLFDDHHIWFHSLNDDRRILALYDYIDQMLAANGYLPPPPTLADYHFTAFTWDGHRPSEAEAPAQKPAARKPVERAGFLFLSQADTDLLALDAVARRLPVDFPRVHAVNPSYLKTDADIDAFLEAELPRAEVVILRLHGGRGSFQHGVDRIVAEAERQGFWLICLPGTDALDPELTALSNAGVPVAHELFAYLQYGGVSNYEQALRFVSDHLLTTGFGYEAPAPQPRHGVYHPDVPQGTVEAWQARRKLGRPVLGVLFYRSHLLSGNTDFIDAIVRAGERAGMDILPIYAYSLKEPTDAPTPDTRHPTPSSSVPAPLAYFIENGRPFVDVILCTMSFAMGGVNPDGPTLSDWSIEVLEQLDVPVLQAITASSSRAQWEASQRGLSPVDTAMNVAIPEFDGRIITVPISFKENVSRPAQQANSTPAVIRYVPDEERIARVIGLARRLAVLRSKPNEEKRIALVLTNQAARASRIGNAVGLDAPASLLRLFAAMRTAGYQIEQVPESGDALIHALIERCSYDLEILTEAQLAGAVARVPERQYQRWFADLPGKNQGEMIGQWGAPPGEAYVHENAIALAGLEFGNVAVFLQPPRGYGMDPNAIYHLPDLPPTHNYHALYRWLRDPEGWAADAIVHVGKHGTLEWLPGKASGPGPTDYPDQFLGELPLIYPFIINDPGEGAQAKRRTHAIVVDHMTPPMTSAGLYGDLAEMGQLVDEYYQMEMLDPAKLPLLQRQIWDVIQRANLDSELNTLLNQSSPDHTHEWDPTLTEDGAPVSMSEMRGKDFAHLLQEIDGYLCELAGAQIRDGLHILGQLPEGEQLVELLVHLVRLPNLDVPSLPDAVADALGLSGERLRAEPGALLVPSPEFRVPASEFTVLSSQFSVPDFAGEPQIIGSAVQGDSQRPAATDGIMHESPSSCSLTGGSTSHLPLPPELGERGPGIGGQLAANLSCLDTFPSQPARSGKMAGGIGFPPELLRGCERPLHTASDLIELIDERCRLLLRALAETDFDPSTVPGVVASLLPAVLTEPQQVRQTLDFVCTRLMPNLRRNDEEIEHILSALDGRYVPAGPSGAPTRGMAHVLPTGRNFYAVDPRALPSMAAWRVGSQLADEVIKRHLHDEGRYPECVGISIWGTSAMRTHGDDIAEVFALLGVRPRWQPENRRLLGVEAIPLAELGRPRIDVVCRISGFFRDAFPHLIAAIDEAVRLVASLDEPPEQNYVRKRVLEERTRLQESGLNREEAERRAGYRIFGCKPGTYGAGILPLIDERNWQGVADFAEAYINWGGYAYTAEEFGTDAREDFQQQLGAVAIAVKNQDNREHDIFDSDDYLQYHGGMIATIRALTGRAPHRYFGDSADPRSAKVRDLKEEAARVFRSRVVNPKWIESIRRHGYKGGLEMASTVDYLFGYDATADVVDDWMYARLTEAYVLDPAQRDFLRESNPWALRDIAGRLLEAAERGLWQEPQQELLDELRSAYLETDAELEGE
ncbi:MAG: cobaltochelatase subunit CobN [Dehalococcoidia bacterium]